MHGEVADSATPKPAPTDAHPDFDSKWEMSVIIISSLNPLIFASFPLLIVEAFTKDSLVNQMRLEN